MDGHQGVPEPYIILEECLGEAIYDPPDDGEKIPKGHGSGIPPLPKDARPDRKPGSN